MIDSDEDTKPMLEALPPSEELKHETTKIIRKVDSAPRDLDKQIDAAPRTEPERYPASIER